MCWGERDKQFAEFARRYKVVNYDKRGFGKSDVPTDRSYAHAADLKALLDFLEIVSAHAIGHSFGGETVLNFALAYPEATLSLVLIESDVPGAVQEMVAEDALDGDHLLRPVWQPASPLSHLHVPQIHQVSGLAPRDVPRPERQGPKSATDAL